MKARQLNVFVEASLDTSIKLAIARDLERLYPPASSLSRSRQTSGPILTALDRLLRPALSLRVTAMRPACRNRDYAQLRWHRRCGVARRSAKLVVIVTSALTTTRIIPAARASGAV